MRIAAFAIASLLFFSCQSGKDMPPDILKPDRMKAVLWDFIRADIYANDFLKLDSNVNINRESAALQQGVFEKHKISRQVFYESYRYYSDHPELMRDVLDSLIIQEQKRMNSERPREKLPIPEDEMATPLRQKDSLAGPLPVPAPAVEKNKAGRKPKMKKPSRLDKQNLEIIHRTEL